jgi:hypothetical protein
LRKERRTCEASMGQTREESEKAMAGLIDSEGIAYVHD